MTCYSVNFSIIVGTPKAIELYATTDIADLSVYTINNANNGAAAFSASPFALSGAATAGDYIYVATESPLFESYFGFAPNFISSTVNHNGDDVIGLFLNAVLSDVFGVLGTDGTGEVWEVLDGWAYRDDGVGPNATFTASEWTFSGINVTDGTTTAAGAGFTTGTYAVPEPTTALLGAIGTLLLLRRRR